MYRMTNEQIENLKREVLDGLHQQIRDELSPSGMILATIDFLASQNRLLADGCVAINIDDLPYECGIKLPEGREFFKNQIVGSVFDRKAMEKCCVILHTAYMKFKAAQTEKRECE